MKGTSPRRSDRTGAVSAVLSSAGGMETGGAGESWTSSGDFIATELGGCETEEKTESVK